MSNPEPSIDLPRSRQLLPSCIPIERRVRLLIRHLGLTASQAEVALLIAEGLSGKEIANQRGCQLSPVKGHCEQITWRLRAGNRTQIAVQVAGVLWFVAGQGVSQVGGAPPRVE